MRQQHPLSTFMANPAFRPDSEGQTLKDNDMIQLHNPLNPGNFYVVRSRSGLPDSETWYPGSSPLFGSWLAIPDFGRLRVSLERIRGN